MGFFDGIYEIRSEVECECPNCGYKTKSDDHCKNLSCPKCGTKMRRADRPGKGKEGL